MIKKKHLITSVAAVITLTTFFSIISFISENRDHTANYASLTGTISPKRAEKQQCFKLNREGLASLNAHGSGMINYNDFLSDYKGPMNKVYVINLRPNENLYYYKNRPLTWYGYGCTDQAFGKPVHGKFKIRLQHFLIRLMYGSPPLDDQNKLQTEAKILKALGAHYYTPLKNNGNWLTDLSYMDSLISFFEKLPKDAIIHIHCLHGKGRTTAFLVLYDIFINHKKVSLEDIIKRHYCLGREDLFDTTVWKANSWTQEALNARKNLVVQFYAYMTSPDGYGHQTWDKWSQNKNFSKTPIQIHQKSKKT